jgi:hypothetical protein
LDPVTLTLVVSAAAGATGGAAGKIVEKTIDIGGRWLGSYYERHQPEVQAAAAANASDFLEKLAERVDLLEKEAGATGSERISTAQDDPDFAALLHDSLLASARTTSEEKHALLARLVSERLRYSTESLVALTVPLAAEALPRLTRPQLRFLGLSTLVQGIRPIPFRAPTGDLSGNWFVNWLNAHLAPYHPFPSLKGIHLDHLESLSCAKHQAFIGRELRSMLESRAIEPFQWPYEDFAESALGKELVEIWNSMQKITLTSTGMLIGVYVHDELTKMRTVIEWD